MTGTQVMLNIIFSGPFSNKCKIHINLCILIKCWQNNERSTGQYIGRECRTYLTNFYQNIRATKSKLMADTCNILRLQSGNWGLPNTSSRYLITTVMLAPCINFTTTMSALWLKVNSILLKILSF